jgi:hypothetical protein
LSALDIFSFLCFPRSFSKRAPINARETSAPRLIHRSSPKRELRNKFNYQTQQTEPIAIHAFASSEPRKARFCKEGDPVETGQQGQAQNKGHSE